MLLYYHEHESVVVWGVVWRSEAEFQCLSPRHGVLQTGCRAPCWQRQPGGSSEGLTFRRVNTVHGSKGSFAQQNTVNERPAPPGSLPESGRTARSEPRERTGAGPGLCNTASGGRRETRHDEHRGLCSVCSAAGTARVRRGTTRRITLKPHRSPTLMNPLAGCHTSSPFPPLQPREDIHHGLLSAIAAAACCQEGWAGLSCPLSGRDFQPRSVCGAGGSPTGGFNMAALMCNNRRSVRPRDAGETEANTRRVEPRLPPLPPLGTAVQSGAKRGGWKHIKRDRYTQPAPKYLHYPPYLPFNIHLLCVICDKMSQRCARLHETPPSSSPSGLSSDADGRLGATKLSNAPSSSPFLFVFHKCKAPETHNTARRTKWALTCRGTSPCRRRTRS